MICPKCTNPGVQNHANGKDFYYCRTCKDEIVLTDPALDGNMAYATTYNRGAPTSSGFTTWGTITGGVPVGAGISGSSPTFKKGDILELLIDHAKLGCTGTHVIATSDIQGSSFPYISVAAVPPLGTNVMTASYDVHVFEVKAYVSNSIVGLSAAVGTTSSGGLSSGNPGLNGLGGSGVFIPTTNYSAPPPTPTPPIPQHALLPTRSHKPGKSVMGATKGQLVMAVGYGAFYSHYDVYGIVDYCAANYGYPNGYVLLQDQIVWGNAAIPVGMNEFLSKFEMF